MKGGSRDGRFCEDLTLGREARMREIVHIQIGQCGNQIGAKVRKVLFLGPACLLPLDVADKEIS